MKEIIENINVKFFSVSITDNDKLNLLYDKLYNTHGEWVGITDAKAQDEIAIAFATISLKLLKMRKRQIKRKTS